MSFLSACLLAVALASIPLSAIIGAVFMSTATDNLTAAVKAQTAEAAHIVAVLDDIKSKLDAAIAGGVDDPAIQALADELAADLTTVQAAEAKDDPGV